MPSLEVGGDLEAEKNDGEPEEGLEAGVEAASFDGGVFCVGTAGGDAAADGGGKAEGGGGNGGEAAGGPVGLEEEDPSELLGVPSAGLVAGPARRVVGD